MVRRLGKLLSANDDEHLRGFPRPAVLSLSELADLLAAKSSRSVSARRCRRFFSGPGGRSPRLGGRSVKELIPSSLPRTGRRKRQDTRRRPRLRGEYGVKGGEGSHNRSANSDETGTGYWYLKKEERETYRSLMMNEWVSRGTEHQDELRRDREGSSGHKERRRTFPESHLAVVTA